MNWKIKPGKTAIHKWLDTNFGQPKDCEHCHRTDQKVYDWANTKNHEYERIREHYIRLCRSCHKKFDFKPATREKAVKNLMWNEDGQLSKPINQFSKSGVFIKRWERMIDASKELGISKSAISNMTIGRSKSAGGYKWQYVNL